MPPGRDRISARITGIAYVIMLAGTHGSSGVFYNSVLLTLEPERTVIRSTVPLTSFSVQCSISNSK